MSQGHWRKLPSDWVGEGRFGEKTRGKTWVDTKESSKADQSKTKGKVPPVQAVTRQGDFIFFAVPGGRFAFIVHVSAAREFASLTNQDNWPQNEKLKKLMVKLEKEGKFNIFETEKPLLDY